MYQILILFITLIFAGCSTHQNVSYIDYSPTYTSQKVATQEEKMENFSTGSIKGKVTVAKSESNKWYYEIEATDKSNGKLSFAKFTSIKNIANIGDLVYVMLRNGVVQEYFLLEKGKIENKKIVQKEEEKVHKRTKKRQLLSVPQSETILLD